MRSFLSSGFVVALASLPAIVWIACAEPASGDAELETQPEDASVDVSQPRAEPTYTVPADPPACLDPTTCTLIEDRAPLEAIFETPPGVELREVHTLGALGYDTATREWPLYRRDVDARETRDGGSLPRFSERMRLGPDYERVHDMGYWIFACRKSGCEIVLDGGDGIVPVPVPDARWASFDCVAGRGLACFRSHAWEWIAPPEAFADPIATFVRLGELEYLVVDTAGKASLVRGPDIIPFDVGTTERIVRLDANLGQTWFGLTESGALVMGSLKRGVACDVAARDLQGPGSVFHAIVEDQFLLSSRLPWCGASRVPEGTIGAGLFSCGIGSVRYTFDLHHVFSGPLPCMYD